MTQVAPLQPRCGTCPVNATPTTGRGTNAPQLRLIIAVADWRCLREQDVRPRDGRPSVSEAISLARRFDYGQHQRAERCANPTWLAPARMHAWSEGRAACCMRVCDLCRHLHTPIPELTCAGSPCFKSCLVNSATSLDRRRVPVRAADQPLRGARRLRVSCCLQSTCTCKHARVHICNTSVSHHTVTPPPLPNQLLNQSSA